MMPLSASAVGNVVIVAPSMILVTKNAEDGFHDGQRVLFVLFVACILPQLPEIFIAASPRAKIVQIVP